MNRNVGKLDRLIRATLSAILVLLVLSNYIIGSWAIVASIAAFILFLTSLLGTCPLYSILKVSTNKTQK